MQHHGPRRQRELHGDRAEQDLDHKESEGNVAGLGFSEPGDCEPHNQYRHQHRHQPMTPLDHGADVVEWRKEMAIAQWPVLSAAEARRSEEHTSELQSLAYLVCRLLLEKKKKKNKNCLSGALLR